MAGYTLLSFLVLLQFLDHTAASDNHSGLLFDTSNVNDPKVWTENQHTDDLPSLIERIRSLENDFKSIRSENQILRNEVNVLRQRLTSGCKQNIEEVTDTETKTPRAGYYGRTQDNSNSTSDVDVDIDREKPKYIKYGARDTVANRIRRGTPEVTPDYKPAFHAYLSHDLTNLSVGMNVVYDHITTNTGSHYDAFSGIFTAPVSGIYVFYNAIETVAATYTATSFVKNGESIRTPNGEASSGPLAQASNLGHGYGSNMIILQLQENDKVWIRVREALAGCMLYGYPRVTFSGFML